MAPRYGKCPQDHGNSLTGHTQRLNTHGFILSRHGDRVPRHVILTGSRNTFTGFQDILIVPLKMVIGSMTMLKVFLGTLSGSVTLLTYLKT
jgi:hypothetical protein